MSRRVSTFTVAQFGDVSPGQLIAVDGWTWVVTSTNAWQFSARRSYRYLLFDIVSKLLRAIGGGLVT